MPQLQIKKVRLGQNSLLITLTAPREVEAGTTVRFSAYFNSLKDGAFNPSSLSAKVYEGTQRATTLATLTPIQDDKGTGSYFADFAVSSTQGTGPIYVTWTGTYHQSDDPTPLNIEVSQRIRVVNP